VDALLRIAVMNTLGAAALAVLAAAAGRWSRRPALVRGLWLLVLLKLLTPPFIEVRAWPRPPATVAAETVPDRAPEDVLADLMEAPQPPVAGEPQAALAPAGEDAEADDPAAPAAPALPVAEPAGPPAVEPAPEEQMPPAAETEPSEDPWSSLAGKVELSEALCGLWLVGSVAWFALAGRRAARFGRLLEHALPAPPSLQGRAWRLSRRMGLRGCPEVVMLPGRVAPLLWAVGGRALLCLPVGLVDGMGAEAVDTLLAHELAHYRRRDHWVRALEFLALGLYWWNPVAWLARRRLRDAEEECCDAWVVAVLPGARRTYATALVDAIEFLAESPPAVPTAASGIGGVSDLKRRLTMIMRGTTPRAPGWAGALLLAGLVAMLPLWPRGADAQEPEEQRREAAGDEQQVRQELRRLERELRQKLEELHALEARLRDAEGHTDATRRQIDKAVERAREVQRQARVDAEKARAEGRSAGERARAEVQRQMERARVQAERARAEAQRQVERARAEAQRQAERARAEVEKARASVELRFRSADGRGEGDGDAKGGRRQTVHVVIVCSADKAAAVRETIEKMRRELPSGIQVRIDVRGEDGRGRGGRAGVGVPPAPPRPPTPPTPPGPGGSKRVTPPAPPGGSGGGREARLDSLERRLEALMRELESLRRDMKGEKPQKPTKPRRPGGRGGDDDDDNGDEDSVG
jgi:beta-lactamase regulating signal transducer with metallopeptidase domain